MRDRIPRKKNIMFVMEAITDREKKRNSAGSQRNSKIAGMAEVTTVIGMKIIILYGN
ncbi:MAG: hypothetical protein Harvfovirus15_19 [Harvfovirus sp.]|uniref:Uncharacterized protein n=1 Tax=Harvfovirus sp. TaxID=2487768 RepID=A0A3G5A1J6_9VIRU|nr:MAG: hypothetical protein Harvfovirus15_19 [Harvfovirus sp.]